MVDRGGWPHTTLQTCTETQSELQCELQVQGKCGFLKQPAFIFCVCYKLRKKGQSNCTPKGVCHMCLAGTRGYPFSDCGPKPKFALTMASAAASISWDEPSALTAHLPQMPRNLPQFYRPDIWHSWHLGLGRYFVASSLVLLMPYFPGSSIPERFQNITVQWRQYCRVRREKPILLRITRETVNYGPLDWPDGGWQKAETTTLLCVPCQSLSDLWFVFVLVWVCAGLVILVMLLRSYGQGMAGTRTRWAYSGGPTASG